MYMSGGTSSLGSIKIGLYGEISYDRLGEQVTSIKDIDRDGFWDILLSAPSSNTNGSDAGKVYFISLEYCKIIIIEHNAVPLSHFTFGSNLCPKLYIEKIYNAIF